jgi:SET domain-containing protein
MSFTHSDAIEVRTIRGKGRGVFARRAIRRGEVIERVPVIVLPAEEGDAGYVLPGYCFAWGRKSVALALGYGSLFNHSFRPNARYDDIGKRTKVFTAIREIACGEEITVNYNGDPLDKTPVDFDVIEAPVPSARNGSSASNGRHTAAVLGVDAATKPSGGRTVSRAATRRAQAEKPASARGRRRSRTD